MAKLDLKHSSCQADEGCIVYCKSHADILLGSSFCKLFRITTKKQKTHYVWMEAPDDYDIEFPCACRAFQENPDLLDDDIFDIRTKQEIIPDRDIFCFAGYVYYVHAKPNGNLVIRRICAYSTQQIVEQIIDEDFHDITAESIYLVNFYTLEDNCRKYVMTCWGVVYQDGFLYVPIFDEDRHIIHERGVNSFYREEIPVGTIFKTRDLYYQTATDEQGKFYLNYSRSPFLFNAKTKNIIKDEQRQPARIIQMNFK